MIRLCLPIFSDLQAGASLSPVDQGKRSNRIRRTIVRLVRFLQPASLEEQSWTGCRSPPILRTPVYTLAGVALVPRRRILSRCQPAIRTRPWPTSPTVIPQRSRHSIRTAATRPAYTAGAATRRAGPPVESGRPRRRAICGPVRRCRRSRSIAAVTSRGSWRGDRAGAELRSLRAGRPPPCQPLAHRPLADPELGGDAACRLLLVKYAADHQPSTVRRRAGILMDVHPGLRLAG